MESVFRITRFNDHFLISEPWPMAFLVRQKSAEFDKKAGKIFVTERQGLGRPTLEHQYDWSEIVDVRLGQYLDTSEGAPTWVYAAQVVLASGTRIVLSDSYDRTEVLEIVAKARPFFLSDPELLAREIETEPQARECY